ncbi:hypothetical protein Mapa_007000 [Marchantia paleacea]|nr:hypothetical protein Mapa_007000 [Marchantia paleacea]
MALVVMCGQPCSGKSSAAAALIKALVKANAKPVSLIDEPSLNLNRNESFKDMPSEKNLRGVLRSAVDRKSSKDRIVIIDSLNHIKGYRYELWCLARAAGILYCVVSEEDCRAWNQLRQKEGAPSYEDRIFDDLVRRFERPDGKNRWDSPLFEHKPALEKIEETSEAIVKATAFLTGSGVPGSRNSGVLQPTVATQTTRHADTNSLYELDRATQEVMKILVEAQTQGSGAVVRKVTIGDGIPDISFSQFVELVLI